MYRIQGLLIFSSDGVFFVKGFATIGGICGAGLQKRAESAGQLVLFFWLVLIFWERHAKNCAIMSIFGLFLVYFEFNIWFEFSVEKVGWCRFLRLLQLCCEEGPLFCEGMNYELVKL